MKNWERIRLKELTTRITKGTTPTTYGFDFTNVGINFIKAEAISLDGYFDKSKFVFISEEANKYCKRSILEEEDILMSIVDPAHKN